MWYVMHAEDGNEIQAERFVGGLLGDGSGGGHAVTLGHREAGFMEKISGRGNMAGEIALSGMK